MKTSFHNLSLMIVFVTSYFAFHSASAITVRISIPKCGGDICKTLEKIKDEATGQAEEERTRKARDEARQAEAEAQQAEAELALAQADLERQINEFAKMKEQDDFYRSKLRMELEPLQGVFSTMVKQGEALRQWNQQVYQSSQNLDHLISKLQVEFSALSDSLKSLEAEPSTTRPTEVFAETWLIVTEILLRSLPPQEKRVVQGLGESTERIAQGSHAMRSNLVQSHRLTNEALGGFFEQLNSEDSFTSSKALKKVCEETTRSLEVLETMFSSFNNLYSGLISQ